MANTAITNGLTPRRNLNGAAWNGKTSRYYIPASDSTAVFIGDLVKLAGSSDLASGRPTVAQAAAGATTAIHVGVVTGIDPVSGVTVGSENLTRKHRPASTAMYVYVCDDPNMIYEIQANGSGLDANAVGSNVDITTATAGDTATGLSGMQADSSTVATTGTLPLKIVEVIQRDDNAAGATVSTAASAIKLGVIINSHWIHSGLATALSD